MFTHVYYHVLKAFELHALRELRELPRVALMMKDRCMLQNQLPAWCACQRKYEEEDMYACQTCACQYTDVELQA